MKASRAWGVLGLVALLLTLQGLSRWIPPLQSPDELSHMVRMASLTEGEWLPITASGRNTGGSFDLSLAVLSRAYVPVIREHNPAVPQADQEAARSQTWLGRTAYGEAPGSAVYLPWVYAPGALGLAMGRALEWTVLESYQLARLFSHVFCVSALAVAAWIWRPPLLTWAVLLLPMSLFQMVSPVVDGPAHAMTVLALSLFMRLRQHPSVLMALGTATCLLLLVAVRLHLLPLLVLPLWWAWTARSGSRSAKGRPPDPRARQAAVLAGITALTACGLWVVWVMTSVVDNRVERPLGTGGVALHYLTHPQDLWGVISRTFSDTERLRFYADSFVGNLGWLDTRLTDVAYPALWWGLALILLAGGPWRETLRGTWGDRVVLVACALTAVVIAFTLMLLTWSAFPTLMIEGVQGRYFIAPALVLSYALGSWQRPASVGGSGTWGRRLPWVALSAFAVLSLWFLSQTLWARYPAWARLGWW